MTIANQAASRTAGPQLGCRVLIVEDDYFLATELARVLELHGALPLGPVASVEESRRLVAEQAPHVVLLDINLRGESTFGLATELRQRGVATIFTTGYDNAVLPPALRDMDFIRKPVDVPALLNRIRSSMRPSADS